MCVSHSQIITNEKGRGVVTDIDLKRGQFVCEYAGELIQRKEAIQRDKSYPEEKGSYMFFFKHCGEKLWLVKLSVQTCPHDHGSAHLLFACSIDATEESNTMGRLINHSKTRPNLSVKIITPKERPHLCFFASTDIKKGTELVYDYGDRSKESLTNFEWLKQ